MKLVYKMFFKYGISLFFVFQLNADDIPNNLSLPLKDEFSFVIQNEIQNYIYSCDNPKIFLNNHFNEYTIIYSVFESKKRGLHIGSEIDILFVNSLISLYKKWGNIKIILEDNISDYINNILNHYTYNDFKTAEDFILWWDKDGKNTGKNIWLKNAIEKLSETDIDNKRYRLFFLTCNPLILINTPEYFRKWWKENKNKDRKDWALNSLKWCINSIDSSDINTLNAICDGLNLLLGPIILKKAGILSDKEDFLNYDKLLKSKKKLEEWYLLNPEYNPIERPYENHLFYWF